MKTTLTTTPIWEIAPDMLRKMFGNDRLVVYCHHDKCAVYRRLAIDFVIIGDLAQWSISQHDQTMHGTELEPLIARWNEDVIARLKADGVNALQYQELAQVEGYSVAHSNFQVWSYQHSGYLPWTVRRRLPG